MKTIYNITVIALFCLVIFSIPLLTKLKEPVEYSPFENRNMATPPVFTVESIFSGEYLPQWDKYFADQIWIRNDFLKLYTFFEVNLLKKQVVNDVVVQKDILLPFNKFSNEEYNFSQQALEMADSLSQINSKAAEYGGKFIYAGAPEQMSMLRDYYPAFFNNENQKLSAIENQFSTQLAQKDISFINMKEKFIQSEDYIKYYLTTDHHYNLFGAYATYRTIIDEINLSGFELPVLNDEDIEFHALENPFYGSRSRKLYNVYNSGENLYYYIPKSPIPFARYDNGEKTEDYVFHLPENKIEAATYNIYMGGDIGETIIMTEREELPNVLLFGDSFTNPLETFLYYSFNQTVSLDLRHYSDRTILEYIDMYKPDFIICLRDDTAYLSFDGNGNIK